MVDSASHGLVRRAPHADERWDLGRAEGSGPRDVRRGEDEEATRINTASSDVFSMSLRACQRFPENPAAWELLEQAARAQAQVEQVFALYRDVLASELPPSTLLAIGERAVRFHDQWDEDGEAVLEVLGRLLEIDPTLQWAFDRASVQLTMLGRWGDLLGLYDGAIAIGESGRRLTLLDEAAHVAKDGAGQLDRAIGYLDALFEASGRPREVAASLDRLLAQQDRHHDRIHLWERRVEVATPSEAAELLEKIAAAPTASARSRHRALDALRARCDAEGRPSDLMRVLGAALPFMAGADAVGIQGELLRLHEQQLRSAGDKGRRLALRRDIARLHVALGDPRACIGALRDNLADDPDDAATIDALGRIHGELGEHLEAIVWLERSLAAASAQERSDRASRLARAHLAADQRDQALAVLERRLREEPTDLAARTLLIELRRVSDDREALVSALIEGATYIDGPRQRVLLREAAEVLTHELGELDQAIALLRRVVADDPGDAPARAELADALRRTGRSDEARAIAAALVVQFGRRHAPERSAMHLLLARIARAEGDDMETMRQLELAVGTDARNASAQRLLGRLARKLGQPARAERAFQILLQLQRRGLERSTRDGAGFALSETLFELHRTAAALGDSGRAAENLASAFDAARDDEDEARRLEHVLRSADLPELLLRALEQRLPCTPGATARASIFAEVSAIQESLGRHADALESALQGLALEPGEAAMHARARSESARLGQTERYVGALEARIDAALGQGNGKLGCDLLLRLGRLHEQDMTRPDAAADAYRRAEDTSENVVEVWRAMADLAARNLDRETCLAALRKLADSPELQGDDRADVLYQIADLELESGDTTEMGLATMALAIACVARPAVAARSLRKALHVTIDREPVVRLYEAVARASGDDALLLEALWAASTLPRPEQELLMETFALVCRLDTGERAIRLLERAVEVARQSGSDPAEALWALRELAERSQAAGDLRAALLWLSRAADVSEPRESARLLMQAAELAEGPASDPDLAAQSYERILESDPGDADAWSGLLALQRVRAAAGEPEPLALALSRAAVELRQPDDRNRARMELAGSLMPRPDQSARAREILEAVLDEDPDHDEAALQLAELLERAGDDAALGALLSRQLDGARDRGDRRAGLTLALRVGSLLSESRPRDAIDVYRGALDWIPEHPRLLRRLVALLDPRDDAAERAARTEQLISHVHGPRRFELALTLFEAYRVLGDVAGLERALDVACGIDPGSPAVRGLLRDFAESLVQSASDRPAEAAVLLCRAATILRDRLADPVAARSVLEQAIEQEPDALPVVELLARCALDAGDRDAAVAAVTAAIERCDVADPTLAERFALRAHLRSRCDEPDLAVADLEHALALDGDRWLPQLQAALRQACRAASSAGDLDAERRYVMRQSELLERSGEAVAARAMLSDLVEGSFYDREVTEQVLALDVAAERWPEVVKECRKLLDFECGAELTSVALLLADACDRLGCPDEARRGLERAHGWDPGNTALRDRLRALYERTAAHGPLADLLLAEAGEAADEDHRFELLREAGRLRLRRTDAPASAIGPLSEAASLSPTDHEVTVLLADALIAAGLLDDAATLLEEAIARHGGKRSHHLSSLQHRMARVAAGRAPDEQLPWLVTAFGGYPKDPEIASDLAEVATAHRQYEIALSALRAVVAASEGSPVVRAAAYARQARIAQLQGDVPRALFLAKKAKSEHPELPEAAALLQELGARA